MKERGVGETGRKEKGVGETGGKTTGVKESGRDKTLYEQSILRVVCAICVNRHVALLVQIV